MCKRVTILIELSLILLSLCACLCSATYAFANQLSNSSYEATVGKLKYRKIRKINIHTERHKKFIETEGSNDDNDLMDDQDNPDYSFHLGSIIKSQAIKNETNRFFQHMYYHPYKVYKWSIIRC